MDDMLSEARKIYADLVSHENDKTVRVGRYPGDADKEPAIWENILDNLGLRDAPAGGKFLDVGCGCGKFTDNAIRLAKMKSLSLDLIDFPEIIDVLRSQYLPSDLAGNIRLIPGAFPSELPAGYASNARFDYILMYSVIHYSGQPLELIRAAVRMLAPHGRLFLGDVANVNKKGRFLASARGREFDAAYKKLPLGEVPVYSSHEDFVASGQAGNTNVNDDMVTTAFAEFRDAGYDVFVLPQPSTFPFCFTREDILIRRYD
jgi:SAM-dependent methyltransferase